jgi:hypothetical protein
VMAAVGIGFERHRASQVRRLLLSYAGPIAPPIRQLPDRCNNATGVLRDREHSFRPLNAGILPDMVGKSAT